MEENNVMATEQKLDEALVLFKTAFDEMQNGQYLEAERHFDMYVLKCPSDWRGFFYRTYCKCHTGKVGEIPRQAQDFEGAFIRALNEIIKMQDEEQKVASLNIIISYLNEQANYFIYNGKRVGGVFGSATVGLSTVSASKKMLKNCTTIVKPYCVNSPALLTKLSDSDETLKKGNNTVFIIIGIAILVFALSIIYVLI